MDEYNQGWDPEIKQYFRKIMKSFGMGALWLLTIATLGFAFRLAIVKDGLRWHNLVFYGISFVTLSFLLFFFYRLWRTEKPPAQEE